MTTLQGQLLIASPRLEDPNFSHGVVLMLQHNNEGAIGVVLNQPLPDMTIRKMCEQILETDCAYEGLLLKGGPCDGPLMVVHTDEDAQDMQIMPGLFFTTDRVKIESILRNGEPQARFFVGYSGWGAGQLEGEMEIGSWLITPARAEHVFDGGEKLWQKVVAEATLGKWIDPTRIPEDPSVN